MASEQKQEKQQSKMKAHAPTLNDAVGPGVAIDRLDLRAESIGRVPLADIAESSTNPRKDFGDLDELAASILRDGVLVPVIVRRFGPEGAKYELLCGARRFRASRKAELQDIPAIVVNCSDEEALELQLVENSQRSDVHPMEEAEGLERLMVRLGNHPDPIGQVAMRVGKSRAHVARRVKLLALPEAARDLFRAGKISADAALVIARIAEPEIREKAAKELLRMDWKGQYPSARELAEQIEQSYLLELQKAPFERSDATLLPSAGACGPCPKRTGNQVDLFGNDAGKNLCTDPACYRAKCDAFWKRESEAAKSSGQEVIEGEKAKKLFSYSGGGYLDPKAGFIDPEDEYSRFDQKKDDWIEVPWSKVLRDRAPAPVLARTPDGKIKKLWRVEDFKAALKEVDPKIYKEQYPSGSASSSSSNDEWKKRQAREREESARLVAVRDELAARAGKLFEEPFLRLLVRLSDVDLSIQAKAAGKKEPDYVASASAAELKSALIVGLTTNYGRNGLSYDAEREVRKLAKELKIDGKKLLEEKRAREKAEKEAAAAAMVKKSKPAVAGGKEKKKKGQKRAGR